MKKWRIAAFLLLAVSIALGIFAFQAERETKTIEKDLILHYTFSHHKMTEMLGRVVDSFDEEEKLNENLHLTDKHLDKLSDVTGNATPIGKHAAIPINFEVYFASPVSSALQEMKNNDRISESTKAELKSFYDQVSAIDEELEQLHIENAGAEALRQELRTINDELELGSPT
ncbi:hypothetical protein [Salimicrobium flavidum]|uniref:Uncharacterized protein n=1 Tax=Salimicrobium flavidum TaxID=570947 RepID=A0A1N7J885_9BACI|nr:hypothetical protein [Salimicrobium flavidum]SIS45529.1 hypothetical protein SAMN05421687_104123 [Salimicrobium flavidum]